MQRDSVARQHREDTTTSFLGAKSEKRGEVAIIVRYQKVCQRSLLRHFLPVHARARRRPACSASPRTSCDVEKTNGRQQEATMKMVAKQKTKTALCFYVSPYPPPLPSHPSFSFDSIEIRPMFLSAALYLSFDVDPAIGSSHSPINSPASVAMIHYCR